MSFFVTFSSVRFLRRGVTFNGFLP
jgi:hypothetical protein